VGNIFERRAEAMIETAVQNRQAEAYKAASGSEQSASQQKQQNNE